jgi:hypothetical protein
LHPTEPLQQANLSLSKDRAAVLSKSLKGFLLRINPFFEATALRGLLALAVPEAFAYLRITFCMGLEVNTISYWLICHVKSLLQNVLQYQNVNAFCIHIKLS